MRISDWSSDVCSSDLLALGALAQQRHRADRGNRRQRVQPVQAIECAQHLPHGRQAGTAPGLEVAQRLLGTAGRVGQGQRGEVAGTTRARALVAEWTRRAPVEVLEMFSIASRTSRGYNYCN